MNFPQFLAIKAAQLYKAGAPLKTPAAPKLPSGGGSLGAAQAPLKPTPYFDANPANNLRTTANIRPSSASVPAPMPKAPTSPVPAPAASTPPVAKPPQPPTVTPAAQPATPPAASGTPAPSKPMSSMARAASGKATPAMGAVSEPTFSTTSPVNWWNQGGAAAGDYLGRKGWEAGAKLPGGSALGPAAGLIGSFMPTMVQDMLERKALTSAIPQLGRAAASTGGVQGGLAGVGLMTVGNGLLDAANGAMGGWNDNGDWDNRTTPTGGALDYGAKALDAWQTPVRSTANIGKGFYDMERSRQNVNSNNESMARTGTAAGKLRTFQTTLESSPDMTPGRAAVRARELLREHPELHSQLAQYL